MLGRSPAPQWGLSFFRGAGPASPSLFGVRKQKMKRAHMHTVLSWLAVALWLASGVLWLQAATITVPTDIGSGFGKLVGVEEMSAGFKSQASWNTWAAIVSCAAAFVQGLTLI